MFTINPTLKTVSISILVFFALWALTAHARTTDEQTFYPQDGDISGLAIGTTSAIVIDIPVTAYSGAGSEETTSSEVVSVYTKKDPSIASVVGREMTSPYEDMVISAFPDAPIMVRIAQAESHMVPEAQNSRSTAAGLFQILKGTWAAYKCTGEPYNASDNIQCARKIYDAEGTSPWKASAGAW